MLINLHGQNNVDILFEDVSYRDFQAKEDSIFFTSEKIDFIQINSSITDSVKFAIAIYKPDKPSPIILISHGWHQSVKRPGVNEENPYPDFLTIQVDMRGRKYSTGKQDCNGYELYDFYDAYKYALKNYSEFIADQRQVYYVGGSGGGGNGYALLGKFPDLFCSAVISCGISDYAEWFSNDSVGEFRDEMLPWIGYTPDKNPEAYASRSGITTVENLMTPIYIVHGETDIRVPSVHARKFVKKAERLNKKAHYLELKNVGDKRHWGNISEEQTNAKSSFVRKGLELRDPPELPNSGKFIVPGYVVTKEFSVFLNSIDKVGEIKYNIAKRKIKFLKGEGRVVWK